MTTWVIRLIVANALMLFMTMASPAMLTPLTFVPAYILLRPWTIVTYMFLHAGFGHLFFNMLALFFFGPRLELELGEKKFLGLYFASGIGGAVVSSIFSFFTPIIGASGAVYGVMLGFAYYWPKDNIYIYGIFPIQSRYLVIFMTILSMVGGFGGSGDGIAHFAHLGGFLGGYLYLLAFSRKASATQASLPTLLKYVNEKDIKRWNAIPRDTLHPVNRDELDRIMNKMKVDGVGSLTENEILFLDRFSPE